MTDARSSGTATGCAGFSADARRSTFNCGVSQAVQWCTFRFHLFVRGVSLPSS